MAKFIMKEEKDKERKEKEEAEAKARAEEEARTPEERLIKKYKICLLEDGTEIFEICENFIAMVMKSIELLGTDL